LVIRRFGFGWLLEGRQCRNPCGDAKLPWMKWERKAIARTFWLRLIILPLRWSRPVPLDS
jgi:hypothetical protein